MTGAILVDAHRVCQLALFRRAVGRPLVDYSLLTLTLWLKSWLWPHIVVLYLQSSRRGVGGGLWSIQYHKNLHNTPCGSKLSTYKKTVRKILRIWTKKSQKYSNIISRKNQMLHLLGSKSHWIIGQKVKYFLYIIDAFWAKKSFYQMWHLLGSKSCLIIGQQSRNLVRYYRRILSKIATFRRGVGAHLWARGDNPPTLGNPSPPHTPSFRMEYHILVKISFFWIKFQRSFERISFNVRNVDPNFRHLDQKLTL